MADLTTLYRGEPTPFSWLGRTENNMLKGRFFTPNPELARGFANQPGGLVRSMDVTPTQLADAQKFKSGLKYKKGFDWLNPNKDVVVASKKLLTEAKPSINWGQTLKHNVDVSKLAAEIYGKQGLAFLKNNAFRTLAMLGSLPAQIGIMSLAPTRMGNAEIPSHWRPPAHITGGNGNGGGYQPTTTAQNVARTASRVGPGGNVKAYGLAMGGLATMFQRS
jgi:hypothetical protein